MFLVLPRSSLFPYTTLFRSRFDELISLVKVVTIGVLVLFFRLFIGQLDAHSSRQTILFYWCAILLVVAAGRIMVRSVQKLLIVRGYGLHNALVVGWTDRVANVFEDVARYPEAGLNVVGAIRMQRQRSEEHTSELQSRG